jgi:hypothetical protein
MVVSFIMHSCFRAATLPEEPVDIIGDKDPLLSRNFY